MFCSISGEVPQVPVVSKKSGLLYERRLIDKIIKEEGQFKESSGDEIGEEDVLSVQANKAVKPRPVSGMSIPGLLSTFQNEWDELMLETFTLKQHLDTTRQELAQSLYQHDAACRVIARLMEERDEARAMITNLQQNPVRLEPISSGPAAPATSTPEMETDDAAAATTGIDSDICAAMTDKCTELSAWRRGRKAKSIAPSKDCMKQLSQIASHTPHKADSKTGITCLNVRKSYAGNNGGESTILSGGTDKSVLLTDLSTGKVLGKAAGHTKRVTAVSFHSADSLTLLSASADSSVKVWNPTGSGGKFNCSWSYNESQGEIAGISLHPTGNYLISLPQDSTTSAWHLLDIAQGRCVLALPGDNGAASEAVGSNSSCAYHPDGLLLGTGHGNGTLRIWDVREAKCVHSLVGHEAGKAVRSVVFSENGFHAATGSDDGTAQLWDLRKLAGIKTVQLGPTPVTAVSFDNSGSFLGIGGGGENGTQLQVRVVKDWAIASDLSSNHSKPITAVGWCDSLTSGNTSKFVSCAMDRAIKIYGIPDEAAEPATVVV